MQLLSSTEREDVNHEDHPGKRMHKMLLEIPSHIETERLTMRPYHKGDGNAYFSLICKNRDHLREHADDATEIKTEEHAEIRIRELAADWVARTRFVLGMWEKATAASIGQIWIEPDKWDVPSFEIGWFLDKNCQGRGFATEAVNACLTFLFEELHAHKVVVKVRETNPRSMKLAERCGFTREGLLRDHARTGPDSWVGLLCFGMLRNEYENLKKASEPALR